jgi:hypothetical protein
MDALLGHIDYLLLPCPVGGGGGIHLCRSGSGQCSTQLQPVVREELDICNDNCRFIGLLSFMLPS